MCGVLVGSDTGVEVKPADAMSRSLFVSGLERDGVRQVLTEPTAVTLPELAQQTRTRRIPTHPAAMPGTAARRD